MTTALPQLLNVKAGYAEFKHGNATYTVRRAATSDGPAWSVYRPDREGRREVVVGGRKRRKDAVADAVAALEVEVRERSFDPSKSYVTVGEWCVSGTGGSDGYELRVYRYDADAPNEMGGVGQTVHHPDHSGLEFPDWNEALRHAYAYGFLEEYVPRAQRAAA